MLCWLLTFSFNTQRYYLGTLPENKFSQKVHSDYSQNIEDHSAISANTHVQGEPY